MNCSEVREILSARMDGEEVDGVDEVELTRHLAECTECTAYRARLVEHGALLRGSDQVEPPDLSASIMAAASPPRRPLLPSPTLRLGIVMMAAAELAATMLFFLKEHGYGGEDHAGHESLSFTVAVCVGLIWVARRPAYARGYLPMMGVAVTLLLVTATLDVDAGRAQLVEELPHLNLLGAFILMWLLARSTGDGGERRQRSGRPATPPTTHRPRLHAVARRAARAGVAGVATAIVAVVVLVAAPAWGHATLEGSDPGQGAELTSTPRTVSLRFDESVTTLPTSVRVYGPSGDRVDNGVVSHPGGDGPRVSVGLTGNERGTYLVSWRVVSADSHPVSGAFTFSVGHATTAPVAPASHVDRTVSTLLGISRWSGYAGIALLLGGTLFLVRCWPGGRALPRARRLLWTGLLGTAVATALGVLLKGPYDAALGLTHVADGTLLHEVVTTTYGRALLVRLGLLAVAAAYLVWSGRRRGPLRPVGLVAPVGLAIAGLTTYAYAGHAAAEDHRALAIGVDVVHLGAMSAWIGGLAMLVLVALPGGGVDAAAAARRFSLLALSAVGLLIATGSYQAWRRVGAWGAFPHTAYGRELLVKIGLVVLVLAAAVFSRRWARRKDGSGDIRALRRSVATEAFGAVAVLAITSVLVATTPADKAYHPTVAANLHLGPDLVQVSAVPEGDRRMEVHLYVFDAKSQPTDPAEIDASATLAEQGIGPLPLTLRVAGPGHRIGTLAVPVTGDWTLTVTVRTTAIDEYRRTVRLPIH